MAEDLNIVDIASKGVVKDTPPIALAPNIFTDVRNVRFKDGAIRKMEGELLLNNIADELTGSLSHGKVRYFAAWQDPNLQPTGCYYIFVVDLLNNNIIVGQKVYIQDHLGTKRDITPSTLNSGNGFTFTTDGWMHTLFNGGFTFIINNGIEKPHYIKDTPGNTNINNIVLAELPGWDSYNVAQTTHSDTFSTGDSNVFDLGQKVDFAANSISVTGTTTKNAQGGSPAGSGTVNGTNFVPGALPGSTPSVTGDNFQIYTDAATNTTVVIIGNLSNGNTVTVNVNSRNPVNVRCGVLEAFGNLLVAGDLTEIDTSGATIRRLSGVVRTSDVAAPGALPINWNPFEAGASTADEFTLSETSQIQDMKPLQGNMYIYATDSIHAMRLTGNVNVPVSFAPVTDEYGALTKGAVKEYDGKHFVVGRNDIYVFQGNPSNIQSLAGGRVQTYFFNNLNPIHENQLMLMQNHLENEIWVCYPTLDSLAGELDEVLIWNYRDNTWTIRDLNGVMSGDMGPVKGGGILGPQNFVPTGATCQLDVGPNKERTVQRYIYNSFKPTGNTPIDGDDGAIKDARGLIPGLLENAVKLNPMDMFESFLDTNPKCMMLKMPTTTSSGSVIAEEYPVSVVDIGQMDPCSFTYYNKRNPVTQESCGGGQQQKKQRSGFENIYDKTENVFDKTYVEIDDIFDTSELYIFTMGLIFIYVALRACKIDIDK